VVALMYVMLLVGLAGSSLALGLLLQDFSQLRLIKVVQGAAVVSIVLNCIALWQQEPRDPSRTSQDQPLAAFRDSWRRFITQQRARRFLIAIGLGTAGFSMQEIVLEPYGAQVLGLTVSATTALTALLAAGSLAAFALAARQLGRGADPARIAATGATVGLLAFSIVVFAGPLHSAGLFRLGTLLIGFGGGLFGVGGLACAMSREHNGESGMAIGAWGAVQASAMGLAIVAGGLLRDVVGDLAASGALGSAMTGAATGYGFVYHVEIAFLFAALVALGPLVQTNRSPTLPLSTRFGIAALPG
jgi:BCD family chlorophyll transporter-like MFS transporter